MLTRPPDMRSGFQSLFEAMRWPHRCLCRPRRQSLSLSIYSCQIYVCHRVIYCQYNVAVVLRLWAAADDHEGMADVRDCILGLNDMHNAFRLLYHVEVIYGFIDWATWSRTRCQPNLFSNAWLRTWSTAMDSINQVVELSFILMSLTLVFFRDNWVIW